MSETPSILHQADVEEVINKEINDDQVRDIAAFAKRGTAVIASPTADVASLKVAVDAIRAALTAAKVTN